MVASTALSFTNVVKNLGGFQLKFDEIKLKSGEIIGLIGDNGAGKSTLIELILGLRRPDEGEIHRFIDGVEYGDLIRWKDAVGFVFDDLYFYEYASVKTLSSMLKDAYSKWDQDRFDGLVSRLGLPEDKNFKDYSRGMRMRVSLAASLAHSPRLLLLDEPTSGLDTKTRTEILEVLAEENKQNGTTILLSSHIITDIEKIASSVLFMEEGKVRAYASVPALKEQYETLEKAYENVLGGGSYETAD